MRRHTNIIHSIIPIDENEKLLFSVSGLAKITFWQWLCMKGVSPEVSTPYTDSGRKSNQGRLRSPERVESWSVYL